MISGPEALSAERNRQIAERRNVKATDTTPQPLQHLRRVMRGLWWEYHKRQLNLLELVTSDERQWQVARNQSLALINEGEEVMVKALYSMFGVQSPPEEKRPARGEGKE